MEKSKEELLKACNEVCHNTLMQTLGIEYIEIGDESLVARMPVNSKVHQPDGVLHGGATVALAESVGSAAAFMFLDGKDSQIRGIEIAANHVRSVKEGYVYARATVIHKGRTTQLWQIAVENESGQLVSMVKLTTLVLRPN